jgi:hypothetical protein
VLAHVDWPDAYASGVGLVGVFLCSLLLCFVLLAYLLSAKSKFSFSVVQVHSQVPQHLKSGKQPNPQPRAYLQAVLFDLG